MEEKQEINLEQKPTTPPNATIHLLTQYIRALSDNVNKKTLPTSLNLIFDSGAVEGIVAIGTALYIHHLEKNSVFKINKVSGCSIGSMIALWYICGCPEEIYTFMEDLFAYYKREKNFYIYEQTVRNMVSIFLLSSMEDFILLIMIRKNVNKKWCLGLKIVNTLFDVY